MLKHRVLRVRFPEGSEVELHPSAFVLPSVDAPDQPDSDACNCTHSIEVEHNADGLCLRGCDPATCKQIPQPAEAIS